MSTPSSRLSKLAGHLGLGGASGPKTPRQNNRHELSPTYFLPKAASIEPDAEAIVHTTVNGKVLRRTYREFADRARGLGYFLKSKGYKRGTLL
jgi:acyl-CoA synthetase (AMP-forming)/AMP-acid ligase II